VEVIQEEEMEADAAVSRVVAVSLVAAEAEMEVVSSF
jgi:hypothetical protein